MTSKHVARIWAWALLAALVLTTTHGAPTDSVETLVVTTDPALVTEELPVPKPIADLDKDDPETRSTPSSLSTEASIEATTEAPLLPLKITSMNVKSDVTSRYAHTSVVTAMKNPAHKAQEATFSIILPETAFITGFTMILNDIPYTAYVKEKEEAKNIYTNAVNSGQAAAHISAKARDSNHFTVSVNVEPATKAIFNLTYEELLTRRLDVYNHVINLNPGHVIPQLNVEVNIKEGRKIKNLRVPELRTGNEIDAQDTDKSNDYAIIEKNADETEAKITFSPNLEQQAALMQLYKERSKEKNPRRQSDYYGSLVSDMESPQEEGVLGQFVIQYDVERDPHNGEIMINDGYFVHFFAPTNLQPLNKHVIFVLDTSGSMAERKIEQLREAMVTILGELNPGDYFNIVEFSYSARVYDLENVMERKQVNQDVYNWQPEETTKVQPLVAPAPATKANIQIAQSIVKTLEARGGTNIDEALVTALRLANAGIKKENSTLPDVPPTNLQQVAGVGTRMDVMEPEKPAKPEPIIIFLTDGDPTIGETRPEKILSKVSELNSGASKAAIFSLAFGEDADRDFLKKMSLRNAGFMRHIYEAADASLQLHHFYRQVASPLLARVQFVYPNDEVEEDSLSTASFHTLFSGSELVVTGKLSSKDKNAKLIHPTVSALTIGGPIDFIPQPPTKGVQSSPHYHNLERVWAYVTIKQLLDEKDSQSADLNSAEEHEEVKSEKSEKMTPEKRALRLALKYSFVTPLTSLVVVKPNATSAVDAESVDEVKHGSTFGFQVMYQQSSPLSLGGAPLPLLGYAASSSSGTMPGAPLYARPDNIRPIHSHIDFQMVGFDRKDQIDAGAGGNAWQVPVSAGPQSFGHYLRTPLQPKLGTGTYMIGRGGSYASADSYEMLSYVSPYVVSNTYVPRLSDLTVDVEQEQSTIEHIAPLSTTVAAPVPIDPTRETSQPNPLVEYKLEHYSWLEPYVNASADSVTLPFKNGNVTLKLTKDEKVTLSSPLVSCAMSVSGVPGVCRYLPTCLAAKSVLTSLEQYDKYTCNNNGYAGVCCPETP